MGVRGMEVGAFVPSCFALSFFVYHVDCRLWLADAPKLPVPEAGRAPIVWLVTPSGPQRAYSGCFQRVGLFPSDITRGRI
jgi:hypothetical protein